MPLKYPENAGKAICSKFASTGECPKFELHGKCSFAHPADLATLRKFELDPSPTSPSPSRQREEPESPKASQSSSFAEATRKCSQLQKEVDRLQRANQICTEELQSVAGELKSERAAQQRAKDREEEQRVLDVQRNKDQQELIQVQREELLKIQVSRKVKECEEEWARKMLLRDEAAAAERATLAKQLSASKQRVAALEKETQLYHDTQVAQAKIVATVESQLQAFKQNQRCSETVASERVDELMGQIEEQAAQLQSAQKYQESCEQRHKEEVAALQRRLKQMEERHRLELLGAGAAHENKLAGHLISGSVRSALLQLSKSHTGQCVHEWRYKQLEEKRKLEAEELSQATINSSAAEHAALGEELLVLRSSLCAAQEQLLQVTGSLQQANKKLVDAEKRTEQANNEAGGLRSQLQEAESKVVTLQAEAASLQAEAKEVVKAHQAELEEQRCVAEGYKTDADKWSSEFKGSISNTEQAEQTAQRATATAKSALAESTALQDQLLTAEINVEDLEAQLKHSETHKTELVKALDELAERNKMILEHRELSLNAGAEHNSEVAELLAAMQLSHSNEMSKALSAFDEEADRNQKQLKELRATVAEMPTLQRRLQQQNDLIFELQTQLLAQANPNTT